MSLLNNQSLHFSSEEATSPVLDLTKGPDLGFFVTDPGSLLTSCSIIT